MAKVSNAARNFRNGLCMVVHVLCGGLLLRSVILFSGSGYILGWGVAISLLRLARYFSANAKTPPAKHHASDGGSVFIIITFCLLITFPNGYSVALSVLDRLLIYSFRAVILSSVFVIGFFS